MLTFLLHLLLLFFLILLICLFKQETFIGMQIRLELQSINEPPFLHIICGPKEECPLVLGATNCNLDLCIFGITRIIFIGHVNSRFPYRLSKQSYGS